MAVAQISKKICVHDPTLPRSARIDSNLTIVVTNRNRARFKKLRINDPYDYELNIDAVGVLPPTWKHAGLPPDGMFAPKHTRYYDTLLQNHYSDYDGLAILAMAACNLTMCELALSDNGRKPAETKVSLKPDKPLPPDESLTNFVRTENMQLWDELDGELVRYVLGMLVRLFYRGDGETGDRDENEQELRKAVILYMGGTGGTSQFINFTSIFMSLELAVGFAESKGITPNDTVHKAAAPLIDTIRWPGIDPTKSTSPLVKSCSKILDIVMTGRVYEYTKLNNRLKHYGSVSQTKYFNNNVKGIHELMRGLRVDAAYVILLGLTKLYGTGSPPTRASNARRTSRVILGMIEDCLDRRGADEVDGVESKIQYLLDFIEQDALKSNKTTYDISRRVLCEFETLVKAARMLDAPGSLTGVRALVREFKDVLPDNLKPTKHGLDVEHDEEKLYIWLKFIAYTAVRWMDDQFSHVHRILHVAQYGRESEYGAAILDDIKHAIVECLGAIYPLGRTDVGISVTCFRGKTGADGQPLSFSDGTRSTTALNELVEEGVLISREYEDMGDVFYRKTGSQPPVVGVVDEIKFNIERCLGRSRPREFVRLGIETQCLDVMGPHGLPLVESGSADNIQKALDELVSEGKIDSHEKEFGGVRQTHYRAK